LLLLLLYTFLLVAKGIKSERKIKGKKKGVQIQAIIGRIRTPDPDPGHFGPDFDSGSGLESGFADPSPCAALTHSRLWTVLWTFYGPFGLSGLSFFTWKICRVVCV
jgi:hypothetical protein